MARLFAPAAQDHGVTVVQKAALLAIAQSDGLAATLGKLDHGAGLALAGAGDGAAAQQITAAQIAAAHGVVRDHLRDGPVLVLEAGA